MCIRDSPDGEEIDLGSNPLDAIDDAGKYGGGWDACSSGPAPQGLASLLIAMLALVSTRRRQ